MENVGILLKEKAFFLKDIIKLPHFGGFSSRDDVQKSGAEESLLRNNYKILSKFNIIYMGHVIFLTTDLNRVKD